MSERIKYTVVIQALTCLYCGMEQPSASMLRQHYWDKHKQEHKERMSLVQWP